MLEQLELGEHLFPCFRGPTRVPCNRVNLGSGRASFGGTSTAEAGTIQLEFRQLARATNMSKFEVFLTFGVSMWYATVAARWHCL